jgi:hypothetical protein
MDPYGHIQLDNRRRKCVTGQISREDYRKQQNFNRTAQ